VVTVRKRLKLFKTAAELSLTPFIVVHWFPVQLKQSVPQLGGRSAAKGNPAHCNKITVVVWSGWEGEVWLSV